MTRLINYIKKNVGCIRRLVYLFFGFPVDITTDKTNIPEQRNY